MADLTQFPGDLSAVLKNFVENRQWSIVDNIELFERVNDNDIINNRPLPIRGHGINLIWWVDDAPQCLSFNGVIARFRDADNDDDSSNDREIYLDELKLINLKLIIDLLAYQRIFRFSEIKEYLAQFSKQFKYNNTIIDELEKQIGRYRLDLKFTLQVDDYGGGNASVVLLVLKFVDGELPWLKVDFAGLSWIRVPKFLIPGIIEASQRVISKLSHS